MIRITALAAALGLPAAALAQEPHGCDGFRWPIARERALLTAAADGTVASGAKLTQMPAAVRITLQPFDKATLPRPPERKPKDPASFAGAVTIAIDKPGTYTVSLSAYSWVDAIQNGAYLKPAAFSGATGCDGIRKSVKFTLRAEPLVLQVSSVASETISVAIAPVAD
ncbi:hypothetical protein X566_11470 [Afipia sp. P52-10]|uniref:hypothetical protein n=1 Tax=Afipia sp. P52-10 TaxID=1429916 RepID=UPI0003DF47BF|nr:hypothetical protein [Afipia sp. P52-10]ETR78214.1 hypothetical protein X566_11470 [Afipia sp. P52-10]